MRIFSDSDLTIEITNFVLYENQEYFIYLEDNEILEIKATPSLALFFEILPYSKIGKIKFVNHIGFVEILQKKFDVRSKKFQDISGNEQAKILINEINSIFNNLTFYYPSITTASRKVNYSSINTNLLSRFDYLRQVILSKEQPSFVNCINIITKQPHHKLILDKVFGPYHQAKSVSYKDLVGAKTKFVTYQNDRIAELNLSKKITQKGKRVFPEKVINCKIFETYDTIENRFVKFFLKDISDTSNYVLNNYQTEDKVYFDALTIKKKVDSFLALDFFRSIGQISFVPYSSTVMLKRNGYKELFGHFINSRLSFFHLLERIKNDFDASGLNNISFLYEVWAFLKICALVFRRNNVNVISESQIYKNGVLSHKFLWGDKKNGVGFNITYSYNNKGSYSLALRPDISLITNQGTSEEKLYFFDAKYRVENNYADLLDEYTRVEGTFKIEDILKMHAYIDAIPNAFASFVVYPGTKFMYFKQDFNRFNESQCEITTGVGAIPLFPGEVNNDLQNVIGNLIN